VDALSTPLDDERATTIRVIEALADSRGWNGAPFDPAAEPKEATAMQKLKQRIEQAQADRIPQDLREAAAALDRAKRYEHECEHVHGVLPRDPERSGRQKVKA
jgi:hypothetical protein